MEVPDTMSHELKIVLISDEVNRVCMDVLTAAGINVDKKTNLAKERLLAEIQNYDGLIVRSATKVTQEVIMAGSRLKVIGRAGTGVDNIDVNAATSQGIVVMNTPAGNTLSATEFTCGMLLAVSRNIARGTETVLNQNWKNKSNLMGNELFGKTLAIIGLGQIGREVALRMQSFGMKTIGFDPIISGKESALFGVKWMSLNDIWQQADYITLHVPLVPKTKHLINADVLAKCKKGMRLINCARGGVVDENALLAALENGCCGGAGLDVFEEEPPSNMALVRHPLVTSTPHLGASTVEAQVKVAEEIAQQFVDFSRNGSLVGVVNAESLSSQTNYIEKRA